MPVLVILAILFAPLVQLGVSFWGSGATIALLLVLLSVRYRKVYTHYSANPQNVALDIASALLMISPVLLQRSSDFSHDILLNIRLALFYILLIWVVRSSSIPDFYKMKSNKITAIVLMIVACTMFAFALIQLVKLRGGYFGLPKGWYVTNYEMLPGELDIQWATRFRPFCTFGEPSYLAFYCISFLLPAFRMCLTKKYRTIGLITCACLVGTGIASQSMAFFVALLILAIPLTYTYLKATKISGTAFGGIVGSLMLAGAIGCLATAFFLSALGVNILGDRIGNIASGQDASASLRIFAPLIIMPNIFLDHPVGILGSQMVDSVTTYTSADGLGSVKVIDNALFNTFFYFGITAPFILYRLFKSGSNLLIVLYVFACFNFNGDIFSADKVAIIGLSIMLFKAFAPEKELSFKLSFKPIRLARQSPAG